MNLSTGNFYAQDRSLLKRYLIITIPLGLILLGLLFVYSLMTKPFEVKGDTRPKGLTSLFSIYGFEGDRLHRPTEVAVDGNNNIYVADSDKHRILIFDDSGNYIESFGKAGKEKYELWYPSAIAVADNGKVFVACKQSNKVVIFDSSHEPIWEIRTENPLTLTVKKNRLYITTPRGIMVGDLNGNLITTFGTRGKRAGQVDFPTGIAVDDKGNMYIADSMNYRVQAFNAEGKSLWTYGKPPSKKGDLLKDKDRTFGLPESITIDDDGILYVVDAFAGEIYIMDNKGKVLNKVGSWGHNEGELYYPAGIAYGGNETFAIADKFNDRVQVLRIPSPLITPAERLTGYGLPIAALIALVALVAWILRRRSFKYVLDEAFLREALSKGHAASIISELGNVYVAGPLFGRYKDVEDNGVQLGKLLKTKPHSPDLATTITSEIGCSAEEADVLSLAKEIKGRVVLLTESNKVADAAPSFGIVAKRYDDLVDVQSESPAGEPA